MKFKRIFFHVFVLILIGLITIPLLTSCEGNIEGVNGTDIINLIFPNPYVFVAQLLATVILLLVSVKLVWKPYNKFLEDRKKYEMKKIINAHEVEALAYSSSEKAKESYIIAQKEVLNIISNAKCEGQILKEKLTLKAQVDASRLIIKAKEDIINTQIAAQKEMDNQILEIAFEATKQIAKTTITKKENDILVNEFINNLSNGKLDD